MFAWINGQYYSENEAVVSVFDRGFLYGDGLFETLRIENGRPIQWQAHWTRLTQGAASLCISMPWTDVQVRNTVEELVKRNELPDSILRIALTRGRGQRGYSPKGADQSTLVLTLHRPRVDSATHLEGVKLAVSSYRVLAGDPLLRIKNSSQLVRVMARAEAESKAGDEALLLNQYDRVAEASSANLFWLQDNILYTPPISDGALPGITRAAVMKCCPLLDIPCIETKTRLQDLTTADGVFLTNSAWGIVEATVLDTNPLRRSDTFGRIVQAYRQFIQQSESMQSSYTA